MTAPLTQLVDAYANQRDRLDQRAMYAVRSIISGFEGWYSDAQVRDMAAQIVQQVEAAQKATAQLTNAYLARVAERVVGKPVRPVPIVDPAELRSGVSHLVVYEALGMTYRFAASQGASPEQAHATALARGEAMGRMDNLLAFRGQTREFIAGSDALTGYRRILRPELSRSGSCDLCKEASDRVYHKGQLLPIHDDCHCGVLPTSGDNDPGREINEASIKETETPSHMMSPEQIRKADARAKERAVVHEHGELGPVLRTKGQNFRGPDAAKPRVAVKEPALSPAQRLERDRETLARTRSASEPAAVRARRLDREANQKAAFAKQKAQRDAAAKINSPDAIAARRAARLGKAAPVKQGFALPKTPGIDALPRKTRKAPVTEMLDDVKVTNPKYGQAGYDINCVHVVATQEMRRRGYAVQATALPQALRRARGRDVYEAIKRWRNPDGSPVKAEIFKQAADARGIQSLVETLPVGGRGWVFIKWRDGGGHIMNVERTQSGVRWLEAQQGKAITPSAYLRRGVSFSFARVDNLVPTDRVIEFMEPGRL